MGGVNSRWQPARVGHWGWEKGSRARAGGIGLSGLWLSGPLVGAGGIGLSGLWLSGPLVGAWQLARVSLAPRI